MSARKIATVLGGGGFVGRYVVQNLARAGYEVRVASRRPDLTARLRALGRVGQIAPFYASVLDDASIACAVQGADVVINLVAVLTSVKQQTLQAVNVEGAGRVARIAAEANVPVFVQMSALGASETALSEYGKSRAAGEKIVRQYRPDAVIIRPSVIFGPEDHFFNMFAGLARYLPCLPVYSAHARLQPVYVGDVAQAIFMVAQSSAFAGKEFLLGGPQEMTMLDIARFVLRVTQRHKPVFIVPSVVAKLQAMILEWLPGHFLTQDQLRMLASDNVVPTGRSGFDALGIVPQSVEAIVPSYLARFRGGEGQKDISVPV
ncbi:3-beta-hydroxy-Delta(5)-steroid dehydrogenase [Acetobacter pasteurianus]|uniref:3-beta-hydroxy-delta(5)-steroid dehydrogenase n=2 Tax=Acetobacter pasteurianus TaxID=438 RepID=C7JD95_ACEP3|nr:complex I NDUFA9 subunit family protein [Acetobacter pasteurianus]ASC06313.1 NADH:ubiquinone reductase (H(+)-translocating) [Acetobacter pasteurianus subsp. pasteurianus]BAI00107.1 3-beta-hydroxy-delta(5)-steroid dehydrogenase [Acetobacter pasteurianus IFO 3283-01]BAI03160.1 3-beta-hydroxy-delta(5)-steroid dehydrogenase [Acetobacter pasteurianus IFO 3283-03]BAI06205.1 3-beta-hydroxy-delta(5)-steroid dehydrogenase [Acetobacter pasteurianus IFO 3283-07]BAI09255.1 3-beta-hydroxy-delta(5)-stero